MRDLLWAREVNGERAFVITCWKHFTRKLVRLSRQWRAPICTKIVSPRFQ